MITTTTTCMLAALLAGHGGDEHAAPPVATHGDERRAEAATDLLELVLAWTPPEDPAADADVIVYLADVATNRPIADAAISLRLTAGAERREVAATPGRTTGAYHAHLPPSPSGTWGVVAIVQAGARGDLLTFDALDLRHAEGLDALGAAHAEDHGLPLGWFVVIGVALVGGLALAFVAGRYSARRAAGVALTAALGFGASTFAVRPAHADDGDHVRLAKEAQFLLGVETAQATRRALTPRLRVPGEVVAPPDALATLRSPRSGRLEATAARLPALGAPVARGDILAWVVDVPSGPERASLAAERARALAAGQGAAARVDALRKELRRKEALVGTVAAQELEALRARVREADAEARAARSAAAAFALDGDTLRVPLVAPFDGLVARWGDGLAVGASVAADSELVTLVAPERLEVAARVFEDDAVRVDRAGGALGVGADARVLTLAPRGAAPLVDPASRTVELRYAPAPAVAATLVLGAWVAVDVPTGASAELTVVPAAALVDHEGATVLYVKAGAERFRAVPVAVHVRAGDEVGVVGEVAPGARVVVHGASFLRHASPARDAPAARAR